MFSSLTGYTWVGISGFLLYYIAFALKNKGKNSSKGVPLDEKRILFVYPEQWACHPLVQQHGQQRYKTAFD